MNSLIETVTLGLAFTLTACAASAPEPVPVPRAEIEAAAEADTGVSLTKLGDGVWLHTSIRELEGYGPFPSHGLVVEHETGPLLIDTAWGNAATERLLAQIQSELGQLPRAAIVTDGHDDRAGGIAALEAAGIEVTSSRGVIDWLASSSQATPKRSFDGPLLHEAVAGVEFELWYPGAGHSPENLVVWLPEQGILFGGCLVRPYESRSLGNTEDADIAAWGPSIRALKARYPNASVVVPSHGDPGGLELLDHTLALVDSAHAAKLQASGVRAPIKMAITVDDLPTHGRLPPGTTRVDVHSKFLEAFATHQVPQVWGYVIGKGALTNTDNRAALQLWLDAGHPLGNHTWSHPNMEAIGVEAYLADLDRNEAVLAELTGDAEGQSWRSFRYPYLHQGFDADSSARVRAHLAAGDYQIAEVSIDFWDWAFQSPYARCLAAGSEPDIEALRMTFMARAVEMLEWHEAAARLAFGRPIAHVLLLHGGAFTAEMIDELLETYEARGVEWVSLDEALADPVYRDVPLPEQTHGDVLVEQAVTTLGVEHPPWSPHPGASLDAVCR